LVIDTARLHATWRDKPLGLTLTEFWIVHALAKHPGHVKNRQQLMDAANVVLDDNTITSHIKRIRRKFQAIDPGFDSIETMYGMGYRWKEAQRALARGSLKLIPLHAERSRQRPVTQDNVPSLQAPVAQSTQPRPAVGGLALRAGDGNDPAAWARSRCTLDRRRLEPRRRERAGDALSRARPIPRFRSRARRSVC